MRSISNYKKLFEDIEPEFMAGSISISRRENPNMLLVLYSPSRWEIALRLIVVAVFSLLTLLIGNDKMLVFVNLILISIVLLMIWSFLVSRSITTIVDPESESMYIKKHGLFGSEINSSLKVVAVSNVKGAVMKGRRYRYRTHYEALLDCGYSRRVPLTGRYLTVDECRMCVKTINRFLKTTDAVDENYKETK